MSALFFFILSTRVLSVVAIVFISKESDMKRHSSKSLVLQKNIVQNQPFWCCSKKNKEQKSSAKTVDCLEWTRTEPKSVSQKPKFQIKEYLFHKNPKRQQHSYLEEGTENISKCTK